MVQKDDIVWVVNDNSFILVFENEEKARKTYLEHLTYYKHHASPSDCDHWTYRVWHETDEDTTHYAIVEAVNEEGRKKQIVLSYGGRIVL